MRVVNTNILKEELKYQAFKRDPKATSLQNKINERKALSINYIGHYTCRSGS